MTGTDTVSEMERLQGITVSIGTLDQTIGTGFFITPAIIVTCLHVVKGITGKVTVAWKREKFLATIIYRSEVSFDLALIQLDFPVMSVPLLMLSSKAIDINQQLISYGFTDAYPNGEHFTFFYEGIAVNSANVELIKLKIGQAKPGLSGAPLFNPADQCVCGIMSRSRDIGTDLGGFSIPVKYLMDISTLDQDSYGSFWYCEEKVRTNNIVNRDPVPKNDIKTAGLPEQGVYVKFRNRSSHLKAIKNLLEQNNKHKVICIVGKGGYGKSALALKTLEDLKFSGSWDGIVIMSSEGENKISLFNIFLMTVRCIYPNEENEYLDFWKRYSQNPQKIIALLTEVFEHNRILILLDSIECYLDNQGRFAHASLVLFLEKFLSKDHRSKVIMTSRDYLKIKMPERKFLSVISLNDGLPLIDAVQMLTDFFQDGFPIEIQYPEFYFRQMVEQVMGIPLAIEHLFDLIEDEYPFNLSPLDARISENVLDAVLQAAQHHLNSEDCFVLQAVSIFDEPVLPEAIFFVLEPHLSQEKIAISLKKLSKNRAVIKQLSSNKLSIHKIDKDYNYRKIAEQTTNSYNYRNLHARAAQYYFTKWTDKSFWLEWQSFNNLRPVVMQFKQYVKSGLYDMAACSFSTTAIEYLIWSGHAHEAQDLYQSIIDKVESRKARMFCEFAIGESYIILGPIQDAVLHLNRAIDLSKELNENKVTATSLYELSIVFRYQGLYGKAIKAIEKSLKILNKSGESSIECYYKFNLCLLYNYGGEISKAVLEARNLLEYSIKKSDLEVESRAYNALSLSYIVLEDYNLAEFYAKQAKTICLKSPSKHASSFVQNSLGVIYYHKGYITKAVEAFQYAFDLSEQTVQPIAGGFSSFNLAFVYHLSNDYTLANQHVDVAINIFRELNSQYQSAALHLKNATQYAMSQEKRNESSQIVKMVQQLINIPDFLFNRKLLYSLISSAPSQETKEVIRRIFQEREYLINQNLLKLKTYSE